MTPELVIAGVAAGAGHHPRAQDALLPDRAGRDHRHRHRDRRRLHHHRPGRRHHRHASAASAPNTIIVLKFNAPSRRTGRPRKCRRKPLTLRERRRHRGALPVGGARQPLPVPRPRRSTAPATRATTSTSIDIGGTEEGYAAGGTDDALRPLLHRHREPPPHARGGDRREHRASRWFPNVDPIGKWIEVDGHAVRGGRRHGAARRLLARAGGHAACCSPTSPCARCSPTRREHMLVVMAKPGMLAAGAWTRCAPCCAWSAACPTSKPDNFWISTAEQMIEEFHNITAHGGAGHGGAQFHRPAGGRHRRDEHHAGLGDRADARDRHPQGHRRAPRATSCCSS